jgi:hypothetical protein
MARRSAASVVTTAWPRSRAQIATDISTTSDIPVAAHSAPTRSADRWSNGTTVHTEDRSNLASRAWREPPRHACQWGPGDQLWVEGSGGYPEAG